MGDDAAKQAREEVPKEKEETPKKAEVATTTEDLLKEAKL